MIASGAISLKGTEGMTAVDDDIQVAVSVLSKDRSDIGIIHSIERYFFKHSQANLLWSSRRSAQMYSGATTN
jgi:hypothetical protein